MVGAVYLMFVYCF